ncbi:hypothetical protein KCU92_g6096, partial [Aureobasidium melanogenum]|jgi:hypothetical protein
MTNFLSLPPELREQIYLALLVEPSNDANRIMLTLDKNGQSIWDRITEISPDDDELDTEIQPVLTQSSIKHMDYSNLWSLARVNKLLYEEIIPIIYGDACLEYTFGDSCSVSQSPVLLQAFVDKLPAATCALYRQLTIVNGKDLSAKAMTSIVDIINTKLPNLVSLEIRAIDPRIEALINGEPPQFIRESINMMAAARPLARLTSSPEITLKPRVSFYLECDYPADDQDIKVLMAIMQSLVEGEAVPTLLAIRPWRRQAQEVHAMNCKEGNYLQLTSVVRSQMTENMETESVELIQDMEAELVKHQEVLKRIARCKRWRATMDGWKRLRY